MVANLNMDNLMDGLFGGESSFSVSEKMCIRDRYSTLASVFVYPE